MSSNLYTEGYYKGMQAEKRFNDVAKIMRKYMPASQFLDVGSGDGAVTLFLAGEVAAAEIHGLELSGEAVKEARRRGVDAREHDVGSQPFPFEDNYFDMVYCGEIIEHIFNPEYLLAEVRRVLKPSGTCVITTPNLAGWPNRFALLFGYQPYPTSVSPLHEGIGKLFIKGKEGQWGHIRVFTLGALKEMVRLHNFDIIEIRGSTVTLDNSNSFIKTVVMFVDKVLSSITPLSTRIILVIKKGTDK